MKLLIETEIKCMFENRCERCGAEGKGGEALSVEKNKESPLLRCQPAAVQALPKHGDLPNLCVCLEGECNIIPLFIPFTTARYCKFSVSY